MELDKLKGFIKKRKRLRKQAEFLSGLIRPFINVEDFATAPFKYFSYLADLIHYRRLPGAEPIRFTDWMPYLHDKTLKTGADSHYFYQNLWAFKNVLEHRPVWHVDVASQVSYVGMLSAITKVIFVDLRPLTVILPNLISLEASVLQLPFRNGSISSLSCLHVAEHVGLGRYGDPLNPRGTLEATRELARVLAPGGNLYFSLPAGKHRVCFNAHRIFTPTEIVGLFSGLKLVEFSGIDDSAVFKEGLDVGALEKCDYGCGLFWFTK